MPADLTRAEKAAFTRLDEIAPGWQTEPGTIHGPEIRAVVAAVRPLLYREAAAFLAEAPPHGGDLDDGVAAAACDLRMRATELEGRGDDH